MPKRASLALLAVVCPAGVECSEAVDDLVLDADRLYCLFRHVVCVCIPRHQHFEIERATGTAASVMPTANDSGTGAGILGTGAGILCRIHKSTGELCA